MGKSSSWRFYHEFSSGFDVDVATRIGQNAMSAVLRFNEHHGQVDPEFRREVERFFLAHRDAVSAVTKEVVDRTYSLKYIRDVPVGFECDLRISEWSPNSADVSFFAPGAYWSPTPVTLADYWTCELWLWESLPYEADKEYRQVCGRGRLDVPRGRKCPVRKLSQADFPGELEWKLYSDLLREIPDELDRRCRSDVFHDKYWDFNLKAMCFMFASSVTNVPATRFRLQTPDSYDEIVWDPSGVIIEHQKTDWEAERNRGSSKTTSE